ncbi:MAG: hypothetical protein ACRD4E_04025 [Bryobacteraceae bacterium]
MHTDTVGFVIVETLRFVVIVEAVGQVSSVPNVEDNMSIALSPGQRINSAYGVQICIQGMYLKDVLVARVAG